MKQKSNDMTEKVYFYRSPFCLSQEFLTDDDVYNLRAKIFFFLSFSKMLEI